MDVLNLGTKAAEDFIREVEKLSGQKLANCYQCHKCTAGCPAAYTMDLGPGRIMRLVQLGQEERVLTSNTIWVCASCLTCTTRCPQEIDVARVMDTLRILARKKGFKGDKDVPLFNEVFLANLRAHGRIFEPTMLAWYNLKSRHFLKDALKGPVMFFRGKLPMFPHEVREKASIERLFSKAEGGEKK